MKYKILYEISFKFDDHPTIKVQDSQTYEAEDEFEAEMLISDDWEDALEDEWCEAPIEFHEREDFLEAQFDIIKVEEVDAEE